MGISNAVYANADETQIQADVDGLIVSFPATTKNRFYNDLVASGLSIAAYVPPAPSVPEMVTNYQARAALLQAGLFVTVDAMVKAMEPTQPAFQAWEFANNFYRNSEFINTLGAGLGLSSAEIDSLFILAASIDG